MDNDTDNKFSYGKYDDPDAIIRVAITDLAAYNAGRLNFVWVSFPRSEESLHEALLSIGIDGTPDHEEIFFADYEAPKGIRIEEFSTTSEINEMAVKLDAAIDKRGEEAVMNALEVISVDELDSDNWDFFKFDKYAIHMKSEHEALGMYLAEYYDIFCECDKHSRKFLESYFDYEKYGREFAIEDGGDFTEDGYVSVRW